MGLTNIFNAGKALAKEIGKSAETAYDATKDRVKVIADSVSETAETAYDRTKAKAKSVAEDVGEFADTAMHKVQTGVSDAAASLSEAVKPSSPKDGAKPGTVENKTEK